MSLLDEEEVLNAWDPTEFVYKEFIDKYMGGSLICDLGYDYSMFDYGKYSINRQYRILYLDINKIKPEMVVTSHYKSTFYETNDLIFVTPLLYKKGEKFVLRSMPGERMGVNNYGEPVFAQLERLCIKDFHEEELKYFGKSIILEGANIDDEIVLLNCNPKLQIPNFKVKRIFEGVQNNQYKYDDTI